MDGNGRWAQPASLPAHRGTSQGTETARIAIETVRALNRGADACTLFPWRTGAVRSGDRFLDAIAARISAARDAADSAEQYPNALFGQVGRTSEPCQAIRAKRWKQLPGTPAWCCALLGNYGGRAEIVDARNALLAERRANGDSRKLTEAILSATFIRPAA